MGAISDRSKLENLANSYGITADFWGYDGQHRSVSDQTLIQILESMGVEGLCDETIDAEIQKRQYKSWETVLPSCTVVRCGSYNTLAVHVPHGAQIEICVELEQGGARTLVQQDDFTPPHTIKGVLTGQASFAIPGDLPLGYHTLVAKVSTDNGWESHQAPLIVVPQSLNLINEQTPTAWGMMMQLYSVRSRESWGVGDLNDLAETASLFGDLQADFLLINPLHAGEPIGHLSPSPYLPVTRRFFNPLYIRPEDIAEVAYLSAPQRSLVTWAGEKVKKDSLRNDLIDRDSAWSAKLEALHVIYQAGRSQARQRSFERFRARAGQGLEDFALWCAIYEKYAGEIPAELQDISSPFVARERISLSGRIEFWAWLQWILDEQLETAQKVAKSAGMKYGICHDLAVGAHPYGADVWSNPEVYAEGFTVGAPPDMYNQHGQNWSQRPWNPDALAAQAYKPLRDTLRTIFRHAGALRIDHVMGLFRLWWIPQGELPSAGAYVRFDHEAMVGILLLEAQRANAVVIGEDLGTVEPWVRGYLNERGVLGTSVFWFEKAADGRPLAPEEYRRQVLVTVDNHDLPPIAGYWAEEHIDLRARLNLLVEPEAETRVAAQRERQQVQERLEEYNLLGENPTEREICEALHQYVAKTPAVLFGVSLTDAVGERRIQNQPGTDTEYPNWQFPLADGTEQVVLVEELAANPRLTSLVKVLNTAVHGERNSEDNGRSCC
ncbi:4-alpha-glucanotransferase [Arcanobacterium urinimassiliense]|uniref:4-alpha-glucanotransferase n=1 Tax=Arcanobacterium urinimassiliense TaxID=1871014 RepID=UPI00093B7C9B|nr:4-alpha-glucanotransferase [Arcanobacterium urinimassiliense]